MLVLGKLAGPIAETRAANALAPPFRQSSSIRWAGGNRKRCFDRSKALERPCKAGCRVLAARKTGRAPSRGSCGRLVVDISHAHEIGRRDARINKMQASAASRLSGDQRGADNAHGKATARLSAGLCSTWRGDRANGALALAAQLFRHIANALLHAVRPVSPTCGQIRAWPATPVNPERSFSMASVASRDSQGPVPAASRSDDRPIRASCFCPPHHLVLLHVEVPTQTHGRAKRSTPERATCYIGATVSEALMKSNANPYLALGVRPFINCCSVRTMHGAV